MNEIKTDNLVNELNAKVGKDSKTKATGQESYFRDSATQNLFDLIYKTEDAESTQDSIGNNNLDCTRFDVAPKKLERFADSRMKKLLKKKFVTGQTRDKVLENLMN